MAVVWHKQINGNLYEVRSAGQTRRLYTNGVFHSQFNPGRTLTGNVWDLLSLPAFFLNQSQVRNVLVLGVGGGAVIAQLNRWFPECNITGIELDSTHLYIARKFFNLKLEQVELIQADAIDWVSKYRGLGFDLIIDDLFSENKGEPVRVISAKSGWINQLTRLLSQDGALIMNFISGRELRESCFFTDREIQKSYQQIFRFMTPLYENQIGVFLRKSSTLNILRKQVSQHEVLAKEYPLYQHKYQIRKLAG